MARPAPPVDARAATALAGAISASWPSILLRCGSWCRPDAVGVALLAGASGLELFNLLALPVLAAQPLAVVVLGITSHAQHVVFHHVPALWRLRRMHHADLDIDVTIGVRFHPLQILLSLATKMAAVLAFGALALAVVIFEVLPNATSMFNHGNVALSRGSTGLRWIVVMPQMHQVHHSGEGAETDSNFGFNLPWWDRLFGTYRAGPAAGEQGMTIGLPSFRDVAELGIVRLLTQPFRDDRSARAEETRAGSQFGAHDIRNQM